MGVLSHLDICFFPLCFQSNFARVADFELILFALRFLRMKTYSQSLHWNFNVLHKRSKKFLFNKAELKTPQYRRHLKEDIRKIKQSTSSTKKKRKQISEKKHTKRHRAGRRRRQQQKTKNLSKFQCHKFYIVRTHTWRGTRSGILEKKNALQLYH